MNTTDILTQQVASHLSLTWPAELHTPNTTQSPYSAPGTGGYATPPTYEAGPQE